MNRLKLLAITTPALFIVPVAVAVAQIQNPLNKQYSTLPLLLEGIIDVIIMIAVPIIILAIVYAGFLFVTAGGKPDQLTSAKRVLLWVLVGAAIILGADVLSTGIKGTVDEITGP